MEITLIIRLSLIIAVSLPATYQKDTTPAKPTKTLVEVWCGGDDVLTKNVCISAENAFESSSDFVSSSGKKPGTLVVTIPTNVGWKEVGARTKIHYTVEFTSADNRNLGKRKGTCWDDDSTKCGAQIIKDARNVVRKMKH